MASNPRKRQQKLERRSAKRKEKKHFQSREQNAGLPERLAEASKHPVLHCWMRDTSDDQGMGWVLLSRSMPNGTVAVAAFLVDRFCLGVKDAHAEILPRISYDNKYDHRLRADLSVRDVPPAEARKFVEQAIVYARGLGFSPHPDYERAKILFADIDAAGSNAKFEFGKDGKPYYISGPHDSQERIRQILATLNHSCGGPDGYLYLVAVDPNGPLPFPGAEGRTIRFLDEDDDYDADEN